ncbi:MAG: polyprenyl synthetase family protein [Lactobacillus sp.]|nr:polyprenyl synthetase family protein [Lactobacillus sp.]
MDFQAFREKWTPEIEAYLNQHVNSEVTVANFNEVMAYSVMAGGKRLRPLLFLATIDSLGLPIGQTELRIACGIELIHTYSLIHDDLPAMDNDDYRRGRLTSHKKFDEASAILAGDALLPMGLSWISASQNWQMVQVMADAIGPNGMAGGQYLDIMTTNNPKYEHDQAVAKQMEALKTGCLIEASVKLGSLYGDASDVQDQKLMTFAKNFGQAFQIYDDLVDISESTAEAGKGTHKDEAQGKNNVLTVLGKSKSQTILKELIDQGQSAVNEYPVLVGMLDLLTKVL